MRNKRAERVMDIYNLFLGGFLFMSPWLLTSTHGRAAADMWASGALLVLTSMAALLVFAEWEEWATLAVGLWIVISPRVLGFDHTPAMRLSIVVGLLVAYLALLELWLIHYSTPVSANGR